jgi:hypothetical protein
LLKPDLRLEGEWHCCYFLSGEHLKQVAGSRQTVTGKDKNILCEIVFSGIKFQIWLDFIFVHSDL